MIKHAFAGVLAIALSTSAVAQSLEPQMSTQDVESGVQTGGGHIIVPIVALVLVAAAVAGGTSSAPTTVFSDARLKTDIVAVGRSEAGLTLYDYSYIGMPGRYRGVMAQEVLRHRPSAVLTHASGYLMVDYAALGLQMQRVD